MIQQVPKLMFLTEIFPSVKNKASSEVIYANA